MPRTKPTTGPRQPAPRHGPPADVLTLEEAAAYLRLSETDVLRLIRDQGLPARQVGREWRLLLTAIRDWLRDSTPPKSNKKAWMQLAGVWKDDPDFEDMLREINKERGGPWLPDDKLREKTRRPGMTARCSILCRLRAFVRPVAIPPQSEP